MRASFVPLCGTKEPRDAGFAMRYPAAYTVFFAGTLRISE